MKRSTILRGSCPFLAKEEAQTIFQILPSISFGLRIAEGALFAPPLLERLESAALPSQHEPIYHYLCSFLQPFLSKT